MSSIDLPPPGATLREAIQSIDTAVRGKDVDSIDRMPASGLHQQRHSSATGASLAPAEERFFLIRWERRASRWYFSVCVCLGMVRGVVGVWRGTEEPRV